MSAKRTSVPAVILAPPAQLDLDEIWVWNRKTYDADHAWRYVALLQRQIAALGETHDRGIPVAGHPGLYYLRIGKRMAGPGHIALYRVVEDMVHVARVLHTAQDWRTKLAQEAPPSDLE